MRTSLVVTIARGVAGTDHVPASAPPPRPKSKPVLTIPAGTKVPLSLKQAISTKTAQEGDPVYAETSFPFVVNDHVVIPAGTYIQGKIMRAQRGGHVKGRAELLIHFTSMIYPTGYTVMLGGSIENTPGAEKTSMKDSEGHDSPGQRCGQESKRRRGRGDHGCGDRCGNRRRQGSRHWRWSWRRGGHSDRDAITWRRRSAGARHIH